MHRDSAQPRPSVSILIPVFNKLAFTRQCLDRIARHTSDQVTYEVIVVDNGSTDRTQQYFSNTERPPNLRYVRHDDNLGFAKANNVGAALAAYEYLLLLNNDTLVQPGWLEHMVALAESDPAIGIVGIKQLFPYTNTIHHTGIMFTTGGAPVHIYPHSDAALPHVNKQRDYQAVNGACLLIARDLYDACGGLDEGYRNGYEDIDLCLSVGQRRRRVVCCTSAFIYHYGQISETRTADDARNAAYFAAKWGTRLAIDEADFARADARDIAQSAAVRTPARGARVLPADAFYLADDVSQGSALTWINRELALSLSALGVPVHLKESSLSSQTAGTRRHETAALKALMLPEPPVGGVQIKWSHYWPQHLALDLNGSVNLEFFVINYLFGRPGAQPWDYWLQCLPQNQYAKLPLSTFCRDVLLQAGVGGRDCHLFHPGYSKEIDRVAPPPRRSEVFRFLTVTNSHDLERYGTTRLVEAYWQAFSAADPVVLVVKDYGAVSGDTTLRDLLHSAAGRARVELVTEFTTKEKLIELYKSCDAFVSAHRGEGFGMKLLDALACGLPSITPLFGGPADYCTPSNCFPVEYALAPMGDCLDTRSLRITNQPLWCEPSVDSLVAQLRAVQQDPAGARAVGLRAREEVAGFTWTAAARSLVGAVDEVRARSSSAKVAADRAKAPAGTERSPYWLGLRISVIVPTFNRKEQLLQCLKALERQSVLPQEFEVVVVDDGSTDGTEAVLRDLALPFQLQFHRQANQGPGAARNLGVLKAQGELVLFIGDDIIADERLLEAHLAAHAARPHQGDAVLGHISWPASMTPTPVMEYVCGVSSLQFAYHHIPALPTLDYRFFYTSNISLKRTFLVAAAEAGITFDPSFTHAAFEDSELAYRLDPRGLRITYVKEALVYHDHWMDLASFSKREYGVGRMAVVFYRKHPKIDDLLQVRWIADWADAVDRLAAQPLLLEKVRAIDAHTDSFFSAMAQSLEDLLSLGATTGDGSVLPALPEKRMRSTLDAVFGVIFDAQRTRGKVHEWYAAVGDPHRVEAAKALLGCARKLDFLSANPEELTKLKGTMAWLSGDVLSTLRTRVVELERELGTGSLRRPGIGGAARGRVKSMLRGAILRKAIFGRLRAIDTYLQETLKRRSGDRFAQYQRLRARLRRILFSG